MTGTATKRTRKPKETPAAAPDPMQPVSSTPVPSTRRKPEADVTYVVQIHNGDGVWKDALTVTVPPNTRMKTAREKAAAALHEKAQELVLGEPPWTLRLLDAQSVESFPVTPVVQTTFAIG